MEWLEFNSKSISSRSGYCIYHRKQKKKLEKKIVSLVDQVLKSKFWNVTRNWLLHYSFFVSCFMELDPLPVTYPEFFWADRLHLGVPPLPFRHHGWWKFLNLVPPDALKMHSLAVPVLRFLVKHFLNYVNWITKHSSPWMLKKNIQIKS